MVWPVKHFRPYLYRKPCTVYTDHEDLKSLLNTPQPSGKLTQWGMAIQELDITILHRSGWHNANINALSRSPLPTASGVSNPVYGIVSAMTKQAVESNLPGLQRQDAEIAV